MKTLEKKSTTHQFTPIVDVRLNTKDNVIEIELEIPGAIDKTLDISLHEDILSIQGEGIEIGHGGDDERIQTKKSFLREFQLNRQIDEEKIEASYELGILYITLPLQEKVIKKITVT